MRFPIFRGGNFCERGFQFIAAGQLKIRLQLGGVFLE